MKKYLCAFGVLSAAASVAHAQSSVTLYGIIDVGINYVSNSSGHSLYAMTSGVNNGSRFGFRGAEDLGGGLKAIFDLENGFDTTSGKGLQGGLMFGRAAYVGLSSRQWGTLTLGRQYDMVVDYIGPFAAGDQGGGNVAAHPGDIDNMNNNFRVNNAIKYVSPKFNGLSFGGMYSLGGVSGDVTRNQVMSFGLHYAYGPFAVGAAYLNARDPNVSFFGNASQTALTASTTNFSTPIYGGFLSARSYQDIATGASYKFGKTTISATYSNIQFKNLGDLTSGPNPYHYSGTATFNNAEASIHYDVKPDFVVGLAYDYMKQASVNASRGATYNQIAGSATYALSTRTVVYVLSAWQHASGTNSFNQAAVGAINLQSASTSNAQTLVRIGLRTKF